MATGTITSPSGRKYRFHTEGDPSEEELQELVGVLARRESDTGQSRGEATAAAFGRGVMGLLPAAIQGAGALTDVVTPGDFGQGLRRRGQEMQADLEEALPVNPVYEDEFGVKAAEALGQGVTFLGLGVGSGGMAWPVLTAGGLAGVAQGADAADRLGLEGVRRAGAVLGYGAVEGATESLGGIGAVTRLGRRMLRAGGPVRRGGLAALTEGGEEVVAGMGQATVQNLAAAGLDVDTDPILDPSRSLDELIYGTVGGAPFGVMAATRKPRRVVTIDGRDVELDESTTEEDLRAAGISPDAVRTTVTLPPDEARVAADPRLDPAVRETVSGVMGRAAAAPSVFDDTTDPFADLAMAELEEAGVAPDAPSALAPQVAEGDAGVALDFTPGAAPGFTPEVTPEVTPASGVAPEAVGETPAATPETVEATTGESLFPAEETGGGDPSAGLTLPGETATAPPAPPAIPLTESEAQERLESRHGLPEGSVALVNDPGTVSRGWFNRDSGQIVINTAWIGSREELDEVVWHEHVHAVEQEAEFAPDIEAVTGALSEAEMRDLDRRLTEAGYPAEQLPSERAATASSEMARVFQGRPVWERLIERVRAWFRQRFGRDADRRDAEVIASRLVARAVARRRGQQADRSPARGTSGDTQASLPLRERAARAGYDIGPVMHHGDFEPQDHRVPDTSQGMHFGTAQAARERAFARPVEQEKLSIEVEYDEDTGAWFWRTQTMDSTDFDEEGFSTEQSARRDAEWKIERTDLIGDAVDPEELGTTTGAFLRITNPKRVADQGEDWSEAIAQAKAEGHDGIVYTNKFEDIGSTSYVVFDPSQVKSAEEITRDESGEVVPEDQRFDPTSPDINHSRPLDPAKIPAILDGSYVPDTDDQLAARSFENLVRYDEGHKTAYKGVTPIARPPLLSGWERVGAAILAQLQGPRLVVYSHPENDSPRGASGTSVIGVHEEEAERVQFIAAHEFWHDLWDNDRRLANLIGGIIEKHTDRLSFELAARGYSRSYKPHHRAEQEVAANLFASAVIDPGFWRTGNPLIAGALRALHANRAHPDARLVRDWDAFVRDVAGITIPSRQSGSFRHSRPLSQGAPGPVAEVFGQAGTAPVEPSSRERVLPVIKAKFFNADDPVSEGQTYQVERFMDAFMDPARGRDLVVTLQNSVSEQDRQIVTGMFQRELYEYAVKLMGATGDSSLYDYMQRHATTDFMATADGMTMREIAQAMYGRAVPVSAAESARHIIKIDMVTNAGGRRGEAIGREGVEEIARAVDAEKLDQAEVEAVGDAVLPGTAQTLGEKVTALTPRGKRPSDPEAQREEEAAIEGEGEVEPPARRRGKRKAPPDQPADTTEDTEEEDAAGTEEEQSREDFTARGYIDRVDKSQVEVLMPESQPNPVLRYIREQETLKGWMPKDEFTRSTAAGLEALGVSPRVATETAERVWLRKEAIRDSKVRRKAAARSNERTLTNFISAFDKTQTETLLPEKRDSPAMQAVKSAIGLNRAVTREVFTHDLAAELVSMGVPRGLARNAAHRAWLARDIRLAKRNARMKAASRRRAETRAKSRGERLLDQLAASQSDTPSGPVATNRQVDEVRKLYQEALKSNYSDEALRTFVRNALSRLGVEEQTAAPLTEAVVRERAIRRAVAESEAEVLRVAAPLAAGTRGTLRGLERQLAEASARQQQDPRWRRRVMLDYFRQLGLSDRNAGIAARAYEKEFSRRLAEALDNVVTRLANGTAPWARVRRQASDKSVRDKVNANLEQIRLAIRTGVMDPNRNWMEDVAAQNGWRGFTVPQFQRLQEIDERLMENDVLPHERARLLTEINNIIADAKITPTLGRVILSHYTASALSGISTLTVQFSAHAGLVRDLVTRIVSDPAQTPLHLKSFRQAWKTLKDETFFALKNDVYRNAVGEHMQGHEKPLQQVMESGLKDWKSASPRRKATGAMKIIMGAQNYSMRMLASIDQGFITAAQEQSTIMFSDELLRKLGIPRKQSAQLIEEVMREKMDVYAHGVSEGLSPNDAAVRATDVFLKRMYELVEERAGQEAADDIATGAIREAEGMVGRLSEGVEFTDEGVLSQLVLGPLHGISQQLSRGGALGVATRGAFGFITIPFRTAKWYAGYSAYGYVRWGIHRYQQSQGRKSPYQQSYGSQAQQRKRLREAHAGTALTALAYALASSSADDDPEKEEFKVFVTGFGPSDRSVRDAWMKRFKPFSVVVKVGDTYTPLNLGRMFESVAWPLALAGAKDDTALAQKSANVRQRALPGAEHLVTAYVGSVAQRSAFQSFTRLAELIKGHGSGTNAIEMLNYGSFASSAMIPWKGAMSSIQRLFADPVDRRTYSGAILSSLPVLGPLAGRPATNVFGDPLGDLSPSGRAFGLGLPLPLVPGSGESGESGKAYELILAKGRGPAAVRRNDFDKQYEDADDDNFYAFGVRRGQIIKQALIDNHDVLMKLDDDAYSNWLRQLSRRVNPLVARELGLEKRR